MAKKIKEMAEERLKTVPIVMRSGFHQLCRTLYCDGANTTLDEVCKWLGDNLGKYSEGFVNVSSLIYELKEEFKGE